jgi:hypothetical protein
MRYGFRPGTQPNVCGVLRLRRVRHGRRCRRGRWPRHLRGAGRGAGTGHAACVGLDAARGGHAACVGVEAGEPIEEAVHVRELRRVATGQLEGAGVGQRGGQRVVDGAEERRGAVAGDEEDGAVQFAQPGRVVGVVERRAGGAQRAAVPHPRLPLWQCLGVGARRHEGDGAEEGGEGIDGDVVVVVDFRRHRLERPCVGQRLAAVGQRPEGGWLDEGEGADALRVIQSEVEGDQGAVGPGDEVDGAGAAQVVEGGGEGAALDAHGVAVGQRPVLEAVLYAQQLESRDLTRCGEPCGVGLPARPAGQAAADQHDRLPAAGLLGLHARSRGWIDGWRLHVSLQDAVKIAACAAGRRDHDCDDDYETDCRVRAAHGPTIGSRGTARIGRSPHLIPRAPWLPRRAPRRFPPDGAAALAVEERESGGHELGGHEDLVVGQVRSAAPPPNE